MPPALLWLRHDLRLADHPALTAAAAQGSVIFLYIQDDASSDWRPGNTSNWWLYQSLTAFAKRMQLVLRRGRPDTVIADVLRQTGAGSLHFTRGYAPQSAAEETRVKAIADAAGVPCHRYGGYLLHEPEAIRNGQGEPYKVFTPFSRACFSRGEPRAPKPVPTFTPWTGDIDSESLSEWNLVPSDPDWAAGFPDYWHPGETGAQQQLSRFADEVLTGYSTSRDFPGVNGTSRLSPHLHFGEISPVQCWHSIRAAAARRHGALDADAEKFLTELLWRDFSWHLLHHVPDLPEKPFRPEFADFPWEANPAGLKAWQKGLTGYPIVDAGMRELWATGFMHNRVRMIAASFLIKHLLIPWQEGEHWFWDTLVDADLANNAASWQWVAGSGADAAPYFRIFNPVLQGEKFDAQGEYVRRWVPELAKLPAQWIHKPWEAPASTLSSAGVVIGKSYPAPVVAHGFARNRALAALKSLKGADA